MRLTQKTFFCLNGCNFSANFEHAHVLGYHALMITPKWNVELNLVPRHYYKHLPWVAKNQVGSGNLETQIVFYFILYNVSKHQDEFYLYYSCFDEDR